MKTQAFFLVLSILVPCLNALRGDSIGCYNFENEYINTHSGGSIEICTSACGEIYYRYAILANGSYCYCGNTPGKIIADSSLCKMPCPRNVTQQCGGEGVSSVYDTGVLLPGPPSDIQITNVTETTLRVLWKEPEAHGIITGYKVRSEVKHSFADYVPQELQWLFSENTSHAQLVNLHPGTLYNITISALSKEGPGIATNSEVETDIGEPDPSPPEATVIDRRTDHMIIHIPKATNINGPITKYRIVVINKDLQQGFLPTNLKTYYEAAEEGLPYYTTAQIEPQDVERNFVIGDKNMYDGYYNAPLPHNRDIQIAIGVVSSKKGITRVRYTHASDIMVLNVKEEEETSGLVMALGVAVAVGFVLLLIGLGIVIFLRRKVGVHRRQRLSQTMPLSGPCIEIENSGFIPDEEDRVDHYVNLKRQLWNIPRNFLEVDTGTVVGMGSFGQFVRGRVQHQGSYRSSLVQAVPDGELSRTDRKLMLNELDLLIKSNDHENIVALIGICEIPDTLYVVLEDTRHSLKELLLSSRHRDIPNNKFSLINEQTILKLALDICKGMEYLSNKRVFHKRLCCRNVVMGDGMTPKISGFGLAHIYTANEKPDYTRWTAQEMFKQNTFHVKSDVWSFGCLLWELFSLGGTLYPHVSSGEVVARVLRGMRPAQLPYSGDDLYQVCLHCWQLDLDERPPFSELVCSLQTFVDQDTQGVVSFTYYNGFQYESHSPELEIIH